MPFPLITLIKVIGKIKVLKKKEIKKTLLVIVIPLHYTHQNLQNKKIKNHKLMLKLHPIDYRDKIVEFQIMDRVLLVFLKI